MAFPESNSNKKAIFNKGSGDRSDDTRFEDRQEVCEADTREENTDEMVFSQLQQLS